MNSEDVHHDTTTQEQSEQSVSSPGAMLRQAREQQGLSQQDIADKIFVKVHTVDDIENDKIDQSMSVTFTKGYVRNYAKHLGLDADRVISAFEHTHTNPESHAKLQSFSQKVAKQAHDDRWMMVTYAILFLLIAAVVAWWYQQDDGVADETPTTINETEEGRGPAVTASPRGESAAIPVQNQSQTRQESASSRDSLTAEEANESQSAVSDAGNAQAKSIEEDAAPQDTMAGNTQDTSTNSDASTSSQPTSEAALAQMTFTFGEDCWVNIKDASGETIATGIKREGRVMSLSGQPPINVTLGAPDNVAITLNGSSVDISSYQNGRTARFTLPLQE